jgi:hypothetical protein
MRTLLFFILFSSAALAQDPTLYLKNFDAKIYSLKNKGVTDFSVDIENPKLTRQLNDQQIFGKVSEVIFRTYWTAQPERVAIEIIGLPEGFIEVKEELKAGMAQALEYLLPIPMMQKFNGYKLTFSKSREIFAQDTSGIAPIPGFILKFDEQDKLSEVVGHKPIGTFLVKTKYGKPAFADGRWAFQSEETVTTENGQTLAVLKELEFDKFNGITAPSQLTITTEQKAADKDKAVKSTENIVFKNYRINEATAMKYFLGEAKSAPQQQAPKKVKPE